MKKCQHLMYPLLKKIEKIILKYIIVLLEKPNTLTKDMFNLIVYKLMLKCRNEAKYKIKNKNQ